MSTAGKGQYMALKTILPDLEIDLSAAKHSIKFGKGRVDSEGTIVVSTPFGEVVFYVVPAHTPFLLCIDDMDSMGIFLNNLQNVLFQPRTGKEVAVVRKWGHPFMLLDSREQTLAWCHMTEPELRQLHRRFGHPSIARFATVLERAGQEFDYETVKRLTKFCHHCQLHAKSPGRFRFALKDDLDFNYNVEVDVQYLDGKPVLHLVDVATAFMNAAFLPDVSTATLWRYVEKIWLNTYLGPPEYLITDAGRHFTGTDFKQNVKQRLVDIKVVPVESHNSIGKTERYHGMLRRAYEILRKQITKEEADDDSVLQMAVKACNDTAGPNGLVPTLLVFGAYPRMTTLDPPSPSIIKRAQAINKAMKELQTLQAERNVTDALRLRNGPDTSVILDLPLNSEVKTWRENAGNGRPGWTGPHTLVAIEGHNCVVRNSRGNITTL